MTETPPGPDPDKKSSPPAEVVGDALRAAVERTLAVTADSATETRQRAQGLLDDVVRRGQVARDQVARRGEGATARLAEAIGELRAADGEDIGELRGRLDSLERRLGLVEAAQNGESNLVVEPESNPRDQLDQGDSRG